MNKEILQRHFIRVAASNELSCAENALKYADALMISQPFVVKMASSVGKTVGRYQKPFLIDPETYRYFFSKARHYKQKKIRAWLNDMAKLMPSEIQSTFGKKKADISNFDALQILNFCHVNIEIQTSLIDAEGNSLLPLAIMCPYAQIEDVDFSSKLQFHKQLINTMVKVNKSGLPVIGVLYLSRDLLLREAKLSRIIDMVTELQCYGIAVWIEDFDEGTADEEELANLKNLYSGIAKTKYVLAMYAGTAQIMMMYDGVSAITHGIHYQISKSGITDGGGPAFYFYIPNLRHRIRTIEASTILARQNFSHIEYLDKVCRCPVCKKEISYDPALIVKLEGNKGEQVEKIVKHFCFNKKLEVKNTLLMSKQDYADWLMESSSCLTLTEDENDYVQAIETWISSLFGIEYEGDSQEDIS